MGNTQSSWKGYRSTMENKRKGKERAKKKQDRTVTFQYHTTEVSYIADEPEIDIESPNDTTPADYETEIPDSLTETPDPLKETPDLLKETPDPVKEELVKRQQNEQERTTPDILVSLYGEQRLLDKRRAQFNRDLNQCEEIVSPEYAKEKAKKKARSERLMNITMRSKLARIRKRRDKIKIDKDND